MTSRRTLLAFSILGLVACSGAEPDAMETRREATGEKNLLHFVVDADAPISQGTNDLHVSIEEIATKTPFTGATVTITARMPAMGHSAASATIEEAGAGEYVAHGLSLPMAGRWEVQVVATRAGTSDAATITYDIP